MRKFTLSLMAVVCLIPAAGVCQEEATPTPAATEQVPSASETTPTETGEPVAASRGDETKPDVAEKAKELEAEVEAKVGELAEKIDQNESAKKASEGLLGPIYKLAESLNFSSFHWLAFGLMSAGVVSFALQLVLGKLVVLFKGSINLRVGAKTRQLIDDAAAILGKTRTEFMIETARQQAIDVMLDQRLFTLDAERFDAFMHALDHPPAPGPKLRSLLRRVPAWRK